MESGSHDHHRLGQHAQFGAVYEDDPISDEGTPLPTLLSLARNASERRDNWKDTNLMDSAWDEIDGDDEISCLNKTMPNMPTGSRSRGGTKGRFTVQSNLQEEYLAQSLENTLESSEKKSSSQNLPHSSPSVFSMNEKLENLKRTVDSRATMSVPRGKNGVQVTMAQLLEDFQGNCNSSVHKTLQPRRTEGTECKVNPSYTESKFRTNLGEQGSDDEDPLEDVAEEFDSDRNLLSVPNHNDGGQTMANFFQEVFNMSQPAGFSPPKFQRTGATKLYERLLRVIEAEKDAHMRFMRRCKEEPSNDPNPNSFKVRISSRNFEGKLVVCKCLLVGCDVDDDDATEEMRERTVIFNPKICNNVDLAVGNVIEIHQPWNDVLINEDQKVTLSSFFSNQA